MGCWVSRTKEATPTHPSADTSFQSSISGSNTMPPSSLPHLRASHPLSAPRAAVPALATASACRSSPSQSTVLFADGCSSAGKLCCDKCDGPHATDSCPHYKKKREDHPDGNRPPPALLPHPPAAARCHSRLILCSLAPLRAQTQGHGKRRRQRDRNQRARCSAAWRRVMPVSLSVARSSRRYIRIAGCFCVRVCARDSARVTALAAAQGACIFCFEAS
jgi:hypothetical protein